MLKVVVIKADDGIYHLPVKRIADNRANYYQIQDVEAGVPYDRDNEIFYIMNNDFQAVDWLLGNMDWDDVKPFAKRIRTLQCYDNFDPEEFWTSSDDFEVVEVDDWK